MQLTDAKGNIVADTVAEARSDWMTEDWVPFSARITYDDPPDDERGYLVIEKSNPSGKPENDDQYRLPVLFPPKE